MEPEEREYREDYDQKQKQLNTVMQCLLELNSYWVKRMAGWYLSPDMDVTVYLDSVFPDGEQQTFTYSIACDSGTAILKDTIKAFMNFFKEKY